jgi:glutaredoxin 3
MSKIEIYSTAICGNCRRAKLLLEARGIEYVEHDVYNDPDAMAVMQEGHYTTVPQIFIDDVSIGGYDELLEMDEAGALDNLDNPAK